MNAADRLGLPTVKELIAAAKVGHLDDRVERYLPDSLYAAPAPAAAQTGAQKTSTYRIVAKSVNGRQIHRVGSVGTAHPTAAKAAQAAHGRSGKK